MLILSVNMFYKPFLVLLLTVVIIFQYGSAGWTYKGLCSYKNLHTAWNSATVLVVELTVPHTAARLQK